VGVSGLYYNSGNWITELEPTDPNTYTLEYGYFGVAAGLFGIYEPTNVLVNLNGSVVDDGLPSAGALTSSWSKVSGSGNVIFANPNSACNHRSIHGARNLCSAARSIGLRIHLQR
jgi:hypothetical protein